MVEGIDVEDEAGEDVVAFADDVVILDVVVFADEVVVFDVVVVTAEVVVLGELIVTSMRRLEVPLGTVPLAPPLASPFVAVTLMESPTPLIDRVAQYLPWLSLEQLSESMGESTVTDAPGTGAPPLYT